jgi:hypothetical protein
VVSAGPHYPASAHQSQVVRATKGGRTNRIKNASACILYKGWFGIISRPITPFIGLGNEDAECQHFNSTLSEHYTNCGLLSLFVFADCLSANHV